MNPLAYLIWNANSDLFSGFITVKIYGVLFAAGFLISQQILVRMLKAEAPEGEKFQKRAEKDVETLTIYLVVATVIGARLGHVLFYEPEKYLSDPISILKIWEGGLASHGASIAILIHNTMAKKKAFVLRIEPETMEAVEKWAADEFRSTNGQLEWIIDKALKESGRKKNRIKKN